MAHAARGTKAAGGTEFVAGTTAASAEVNTDFNNILAEFNGGIDNSNLLSTAAVELSKLDGYSDSTTEARTETNPGAFGAESLATTLQGELERLRYTLRRIATNQAASTYWGDAPVTTLAQLPAGRNVLRNGSFEQQTGAANSAPDGWTLIGTPTTVDLQTTQVAQGKGRAVRVVAAVANDGLSLNLAGLKASTTYFLSGAVKPAAATDSATVSTTGGSSNVALTWDGTVDGTNFVRKGATFVTNGTPTDILVRLRVDNIADSVQYDNFTCVELNSRSLEAQPGAQVTEERFTTVGTAITGTEAFIDNDGVGTNILLRGVYVPGSGYYIRVTARISGNFITNGTEIEFRLYENNSVPGTATTGTVRDFTGTDKTAGSTRVIQSTLGYINENPTPGLIYYYHVTGDVITGADSFSPQAGSRHSFLQVECLPYA